MNAEQSAAVRRGVIGVIAFLFYLSTLSANYPYDGIAWSILLELQAGLGRLRFQSPHYLAYYGLAEALYLPVSAVLHLRALVFLQVFSAAAAALALAGLDWLLGRARLEPRARRLGLLLLALAPSFWRFATTPEVYTLGMALFLAGLLPLTFPPTPRRMILSYLLPVLGHQSLAFLGLAQLRTWSRLRNWRAAFGAAGIAAAVFLLLAAGAWAVSSGLERNLGSWLLGYAEPEAGRRAAEWWVGISPAVSGLLRRPPHELSTTFTLGWLLALAGLGGLLRGRWRGDPVAATLLLFLPFYLCFLSFWDPGGNEFWVFILLPVAVGVAWLAEGRRIVSLFLLIVILGNGLITFNRAVRPHLAPESNAAWRRAEAIRLSTQPDDALLLPGCGLTNDDKVYVPYFSGRLPLYADWILAPPGSPEDRLMRLDQALRRVALERRLLMSKELLTDSSVGARFSDKYGIPPEVFRDFCYARLGPAAGPFFNEVVLKDSPANSRRSR